MPKRHYIIPIFVPHEGCPHDCAFCNQKRITGTHQKVNADNVVSTIESFLETIPQDGVKIEVAFYGGSFTGIPIETQRELLTQAAHFKRKGRIGGIRLSTRPDYINKEILDHLQQHSVSTIELGVQSMDNSVLNASCRGHNAEDVIKASESIKNYGFKLGLQIMPGLPGDNHQKIFYTADQIIRLKPDIVRIYPTLVIKDTHLEELYRMGRYHPLGLGEAVQICKELLIQFEGNDINVIRIGLQATENINERGDVIAGPYHPSFREMVESALYLEMIERELEQQTMRNGDLKIRVHPKLTSKVVGLKKYNLNFLEMKYHYRNIMLIQDAALDIDHLIVETVEKCQILSKSFFVKFMKNRRNLIENIE